MSKHRAALAYSTSPKLLLPPSLFLSSLLLYLASPRPLGAQGRGHPPGGDRPPSSAKVGSPLLLPASCQQTAWEPWEVRSNADDAGAGAEGRRVVHQGGD